MGCPTVFPSLSDPLANASQVRVANQIRNGNYYLKKKSWILHYIYSLRIQHLRKRIFLAKLKNELKN